MRIFSDEKKFGHVVFVNFEYKIKHISKTKNLKIDIFIGFKTLRNFLDQKPNLATFGRVEGVDDVYISLFKNNPIVRTF